jgi:hypothetical protein
VQYFRGYVLGDGHTYLTLLLWTSRVHRQRCRETIFCSMRLVDRDLGGFSCRHAKPAGKLRRDFKYRALLCSAVPFIPSIERSRLLAFALLSVVWVLGRFLLALCRGRLPHGLDFWQHHALSPCITIPRNAALPTGCNSRCLNDSTTGAAVRNIQVSSS